MNQYIIRMDGQEMPGSFSYEELKDLGVMEYDDIYIRKSTESTWHVAKHYVFPEASSSSGYKIDEYGQIVKKEKSSSGYTIDKYGQIVRPNESTSSSSKQVSNSSPSSNSSRSSSSYHSSSFDWDVFWGIAKYIAWIAFGIFVAVGIQSC